MTSLDGGRLRRSMRRTAALAARLGNLSDATRVAAFAKDADGNYIYANPRPPADAGERMPLGRRHKTGTDRRARAQV